MKILPYRFLFFPVSGRRAARRGLITAAVAWMVSFAVSARSENVPVAGYLPPVAVSSGDQFSAAIRELIIEASRKGKAVLVRELRYGDDGEGAMLLPRGGSPSSTVVLSVEIKEAAGVPSLAASSLVDNQEEMIRALNAICTGQLAAGRQMAQMLDRGREMELGMRELNSGVDGVALGVSETSSEVAGVTAVSMGTDQTLEKINSQLSALNQVIDDLAASMGDVAGKIDDLVRADSSRDDDGPDESRRSGREDDGEDDGGDDDTDVDSGGGGGDGGGISGISGDEVEAGETGEEGDDEG
ncbi:MAG: hypothetical protein V1789_08510 [PVC group bacterium]